MQKIDRIIILNVYMLVIYDYVDAFFFYLKSEKNHQLL